MTEVAKKQEPSRQHIRLLLEIKNARFLVTRSYTFCSTMSRVHFVALLLYSASAVFCQNIILTNDDGWAVAQIRAQFDALNATGFNVHISSFYYYSGSFDNICTFQTVLSAPALQESGSGSKTTIPIPLNQSCEFNTCPIGSPATGFNASDRKYSVNYHF